jgi:hypothetical protein
MCVAEVQRRSEEWLTHEQVSEQVGLQKIYDFATPAIDYGLHHEKTEALYLVQLGLLMGGSLLKRRRPIEAGNGLVFA